MCRVQVSSKHLGRIYMLIWGLPFICCYLQFSFVDSSVPSTLIHQFQTCSTYSLFPYSEYNLYLLLNCLVIVRLLSELSFFSVSNWIQSFLWNLQMVLPVSNIYFSIFIQIEAYSICCLLAMLQACFVFSLYWLVCVIGKCVESLKYIQLFYAT